MLLYGVITDGIEVKHQLYRDKFIAYLVAYNKAISGIDKDIQIGIYDVNHSRESDTTITIKCIYGDHIEKMDLRDSFLSTFYKKYNRDADPYQLLHMYVYPDISTWYRMAWNYGTLESKNSSPLYIKCYIGDDIRLLHRENVKLKDMMESCMMYERQFISTIINRREEIPSLIESLRKLYYQGMYTVRYKPIVEHVRELNQYESNTEAYT